MSKLSVSLTLPIVCAAVIVLADNGPASSREEELWRHRNLGKALYETPASVPQSAVELKKALDLAPDSSRDRLNYGLALLRAGDLKLGMEELERAQKQDPNSPYTWFNLGVAYKREGSASSSAWSSSFPPSRFPTTTSAFSTT
jgi:Flp pilus assembly protein TadD